MTDAEAHLALDMLNGEIAAVRRKFSEAGRNTDRLDAVLDQLDEAFNDIPPME
jgi:hypothetical protein